MKHHCRGNESDTLAGVVISIYLVAHTIIFSCIAVIAWLASTWSDFFGFVPFIPTSAVTNYDDKFSLVRVLVVAACSAGVGGGVFMIREFYIKFCYGRKSRDKKGEKKEYLCREEIPRYLLLPFSSVILGPISYALARAGAITFTGFSGQGQIPLFTVVGMSFVLGFAYHDTLDGLSALSNRIFTKQSGNEDSA